MADRKTDAGKRRDYERPTLINYGSVPERTLGSSASSGGSGAS